MAQKFISASLVRRFADLIEFNEAVAETLQKRSNDLSDNMRKSMADQREKFRERFAAVDDLSVSFEGLDDATTRELKRRRQEHKRLLDKKRANERAHKEAMQQQALFA